MSEENQAQRLCFEIRIGDFTFKLDGREDVVKPYLDTFGDPEEMKDLSEQYGLPKSKEGVAPILPPGSMSGVGQANADSSVHDPLAGLAQAVSLPYEKIQEIYLIRDEDDISLVDMEPPGHSKKEQRQNGALLYALAYYYVHGERDIPIRQVRSFLDGYNLLDGNTSGQIKDLGAFKVDSDTYHLHYKGEIMAKELLKSMAAEE